MMIEGVNTKFLTYMEGVLRWNEKVNLTAITEKDDFIVKHYFDSLVCLDFEEYKSAEKIIDIGTGAGFPGIPLAINSPEKTFVLADSLLKRLKIVDELTMESNIKNVKTCHGRAEDLAKLSEHREQYDLCISRAVARLATLVEYSLPFIKEGGYLLAYKGPDVEEEVKEAEKAINILGGKVERISQGIMQQYGISHNIVVIRKIKSTPKKYPRKAGTPSKDPIV